MMCAHCIPTRIAILLGALLCCHVGPAAAQESPGCSFSDLHVSVGIPEGYRQLPTECPKVGYADADSRDHALGFFVTESPMTILLEEGELSEFVRGQAIVTQAMMDEGYGRDIITNTMLDEQEGQDNELVQGGGACRAMEVSFYMKGMKRRGIERRKGLICIFRPHGAGPRDWLIANVFAFEMNMDTAHVEFSGEFDTLADDLFRSVRVRPAS